MRHEGEESLCRAIAFVRSTHRSLPGGKQMAEERVGYRRLYDSMGCSLVDREELDLSVSLNDLYVEVI